MAVFSVIPIILFWILSPGYLYAQADTPVIMTEDWPPYNYIEQGELKGFSVELVQTMMDGLGITAEIKVYPGARGERYLRKHDNHMLFSLFRTPQRDKIYKWIGPISNDSVYFFKSRENTQVKIHNLEDAKKVKRIGSSHEGMILNFLLENGFENIVKQSQWQTNMKLLVEGKYDLIANTPLAVKYRLKILNYSSDSLEQTPVKLFSLPLYIGCSKTMPDATIEKWQNALDLIKASGKYNLIYNKYK